MTELFACVQLEFARPLGPSEGRYVVRWGLPDGTVADVLDVRAIAARVVTEPPQRPRRRRRDAGETTALSLVRYTLIRASTPLADETAARGWLASLRSDAGAREHEARRAVAVLNTAIRAYRVAAGDPYAVEVSPADAHAIRFGAGTPRQAFDGEGLAWLTDGGDRTGAPSRAQSAPDRLGPARAVAAALGGRAAPQAADDLVLRALLDLRHGNPRAAAAVLGAAVEVIVTAPEQAGVPETDADHELLLRARSVTRAALAPPSITAAEQAALCALAVELRERLQTAARQQLEASESTSGSLVIEGECMSKVQLITDRRGMVGELLSS